MPGRLRACSQSGRGRIQANGDPVESNFESNMDLLNLMMSDSPQRGWISAAAFRLALVGRDLDSLSQRWSAGSPRWAEIGPTWVELV